MTSALLLFALAAGSPTDAALTEHAIEARIQRYRMADFTVVVKDPKGRPVPNAEVTVAQTKHAFLFGANVLPLRTDVHEDWQAAYQARYAALFNFAAVGFFWDGYEPQKDKPIDGFIRSQVDWLRAHDIVIEGTPLVWHMSYPAWAPKDADTTIPLLHERVDDLIDRYRKDIRIWILNNESLSASGDNGVADWTKRDGPARVVATSLDWAKEVAKGTPETFLYNDYEIGEPHLALLKRLRTLGKLPDGIGIQAHMHQGTRSIGDWWDVCERFAEFGKPLYFTESTVLSGPIRRGTDIPYAGPPAKDWTTTPEGEAAQADYVERFYTALFSHPAVRAINWWDLSDRDAWLGAPAGLLRKDMSPKPAYTRLMTLIYKKWWTKGTGKTDAQGRYRVHAFYGDYNVIATAPKGRLQSRTVVWPEASGPAVTVLTLR